MKTMDTKREVWLDWMRVIACLLVMVVHATEPFYLGGEGSRVLTRSDAFWVSFFEMVSRACVPLFVVASSYLQFPLHYSTGQFFKRRAARILIPFALWTVVYALMWGEPVDNFKGLLLNFNYAAGHLWFVYMLLGLYLLMPLLSPWAEKVSRRELGFYLAVFAVTTSAPYIREAMGGTAPVIYGPTGIPNPARYPLWGEASWNSYGLLYYFSGFIGYMLLGLWLRKFTGELSWRRTLSVAVPALLAGGALTFGGFYRRILADASVFPFEGPVSHAALWETPICNDTIGVLLMTIGTILLLKKINSSGRFYRSAVLSASKAGYGMYLSHMVFLSFFAGVFRGWLGLGDAGRLGFWTTPAEIILTALASFTCTAIACILVQRIPKAGKWIVG